MFKNKKNSSLRKLIKDTRGPSLVETLIGLLVLVTVSLALFALIDLTLRVFWENKARTTANALANEKMEIIRNLPYVNVGTIGGIPSGTLAQEETASRNGIQFHVKTSVIYIDD